MMFQNVILWLNCHLYMLIWTTNFFFYFCILPLEFFSCSFTGFASSTPLFFFQIKVTTLVWWDLKQICLQVLEECLSSQKTIITNFMGRNLAIIVMQNLLFISSYGIDMDVIHLFVLFEHRCHVHRLDTNVICLFILFKHECCVFIRIVYTRKLCTWFLCLNNAWHSCVNDMNPWNNRFCMDLEWTHEAYKFVMMFWWENHFPSII